MSETTLPTDVKEWSVKQMCVALRLIAGVQPETPGEFDSIQAFLSETARRLEMHESMRVGALLIRLGEQGGEIRNLQEQVRTDFERITAMRLQIQDWADNCPSSADMLAYLADEGS